MARDIRVSELEEGRVEIVRISMRPEKLAEIHAGGFSHKRRFDRKC